jgi:outer membrane protein assembly factor BamB
MEHAMGLDPRADGRELKMRSALPVASRVTRLALTLWLSGLCVHARAEAASGVHDLSGVWEGPLAHNAQSSRFALRLTAVGDSACVVRVSLPAIDAWDLPLGIATVRNDSIRLGRWTLAYDEVAQTLSGELPAALAPVHRIPLVLARMDSLARTSISSAVEEVPAAGPVWTMDIGAPIWAGLEFDGERVYVGSDDGRVAALNSIDGAVLWTFATGAPIRARPTVHAEELYVASDDGHLYKLRRNDGTEIWRVRLFDGSRERIPPGGEGSRYDHYGPAPVIVDETVYVGSADGRLRALAEGSSESLWEFESGDVISGTPAVHESRVIFGSFDGRIYSLDARTGNLVWSFDTQAPVVSSPAIAADRVLIGSRSYDFFALNAATGEPEWKHYLWFSWVESSASVQRGIAYFGSSDAQLVTALDASTGEIVWETDVQGSAWARPAVDGTSVFIGTVGVADYIVDHRGGFFALDRQTGAIRWCFESERPAGAALWGFASSPSVGEGMVFVGVLDGKIYAFSADLPGAD